MSVNTKCPVRIVLASASPRRQKMFADAGYEFEIADPGDVEDEVNEAESPEDLAAQKAAAKAMAVAVSLKGPFPALVVGADTIVVAGDKVIGKPVDRNDATAILSGLSGTRHKVVTGVSIIPVLADLSAGPECDDAAEVDGLEFSDETWICMRKMSDSEIADYVNAGHSDGKAGAYAIQENGDKFVEKIEGSFLNVVGFPMESFEELLPELIKALGLQHGNGQ